VEEVVESAGLLSFVLVDEPLHPILEMEDVGVHQESYTLLG
jgi:hypothetical protein